MKAYEAFKPKQIQEAIDQANATKKDLRFRVSFDERFLIRVMNSINYTLFSRPVIGHTELFSYQLTYFWGERCNARLEFTASQIHDIIRKITYATEFINVKVFYYNLDGGDEQPKYIDIFKYSYEQHEEIEDLYWEDFDKFKKRGGTIKVR